MYTDGGCSGNPGRGAWACVILGPAKDGGSGLELCVEDSGGEVHTTNNRMELRAVIEALRKVKFIQSNKKITAFAKITVYTDSQYVQRGITQWIEGWKRNAWKTSSKQPVKNQDLWIELDSASRNLPLDWRWVAGHAGITYNERCDSMVRAVIKNFA